jgi:phosphoglycerol transferase MdoB-like AlkP superfamily enzyme
MNFRALPIRIGWLAAASLGFVLYNYLIERYLGVRILSPSLGWGASTLNALPGLLVALVLVAVTCRVAVSFLLVAALQGLLMVASYIKYYYLRSPIIPSDFRLGWEMAQHGFRLLAGYLPHSSSFYILGLLGLVVLCLVWRIEPRFYRVRGPVRFAIALTALVIAYVGYTTGRPLWSRIYTANMASDSFAVWSPTTTSANHGEVTMLLEFSVVSRHHPDAPDKIVARKFVSDVLAADTHPLTTPTEAPDVIVIQSESLFDPSILASDPPIDVLPNLHRIARGSTSGKLHVPTFGGGTIRTEFEVLTGLSLRYFDDLAYPYLQFSFNEVSTLPGVFHSHGYATTAVHGNDPDTWNRRTAFHAMGFDDFISFNAFDPDAHDGMYLSDRAMTDKIIQLLHAPGQPKFVFAISIEAHGAWSGPGTDVNRPDQRDAIPVPENLDASSKAELRTYLYHIRDADQELGRLADYLRSRKRPAILLFYGDHLPALPGTFDVLGFRDGKPSELHLVPWVMMDTRSLHGALEDTAAWMLPGRLLQQAGINDDAYFRVTTALPPSLANATVPLGVAAPPMSKNEAAVFSAMRDVTLLRARGRLENDSMFSMPPRKLQAGKDADQARPYTSSNLSMSSSPR